MVGRWVIRGLTARGLRPSAIRWRLLKGMGMFSAKSRTVRHILVAAGLATTATLGLANVAQADGTSSRTNGCYGWWHGTVGEGHCDPVTVSGNFRLVGNCDWAPGYIGPWRWYGAGSNLHPFASFSCPASSTYAGVEFTG